LGHGFLEGVYRRALVVVLRQKGLSVEAEVSLQVMFRGESVGDFCADLIVERQVLVELKAVKALAPEHQAQVINYLKATGLEVGLLINFGTFRIEFKRLHR
jgi:GxxExxY protein